MAAGKGNTAFGQNNFSGVKDMYLFGGAAGYPCWDIEYECSAGNTTRGTHDLEDQVGCFARGGGKLGKVGQKETLVRRKKGGERKSAAAMCTPAPAHAAMPGPHPGDGGTLVNLIPSSCMW